MEEFIVGIIRELINELVAELPNFKNTEHAWEFGREQKYDSIMKLALKEKRRRLERLVRFADRLGLPNEAIYLSSGQCQLCREAIEAAEGREPRLKF